MSADQLTVCPSTVIKTSEEYQNNLAAWEGLLEELRVNTEATRQQGSESYKDRHIGRGMLLARDRINLLLDEEAQFLELLPFKGFQEDAGQDTTCANLVTGIGTVAGIQCMIVAHLPTINGGAWSKSMIAKQFRIMEIATENSLPVIALVQSAGVFLPNQFEIFHPGGKIFRDLVTHSLAGNSSCSIVFGSGTAGGAYQPGLSSHTIFVDKQAQVFLGGPPLVEMATGEKITAEALGGAEMHSKVSGLSDQLADDEFDGIAKAREWCLMLQTTKINMPLKPVAPYLPPRHDPEELLGLVSTNLKVPFDIVQVFARIVDDSRMTLFKPLYGVNLPCAFAELQGHKVGIIGNNNGVIHLAESLKGTQFIHLCNQRSIPIIFMHNVTGFMVGSKSESSGLIKAGSRFVAAIVASRVPHISVVCGASYGAGNYAMCGRSYNPRFLLSWPNSRCSVMGSSQLAGVLSSIARSSAASRGNKIDESEVLKREEVFRQGVERDSNVYRTSASGLDDGIIDPRDTREVLGLCLDVCKRPGVKGWEGMMGASRM
ncbi:carboxyl transferase [Protomyces lactucae-debilis]|uniref:methylcrotonoyl-CoA carboxylase n=1 Tax=Protomyces lactucae-debilis TaxID=2754530 RepID=A0A1Y2FDZ8_PROLT|nr:carboxyl transferase [Protomyces lactucae-debilis]ORY82133.1 carboxyl transferase [Protomyces lactucae-debilis]